MDDWRRGIAARDGNATTNDKGKDMNIKGTRDLHDIEVKVRLTKRQSEKLSQLAALTDIPRAVIIRTLFERAMEQGAKQYLFRDSDADDRTQCVNV